ncbi:MAG: universal stress protein [Dysgonamonadaceae bacterium]|jgi:nucleotide-binding universal stress UspA family protein|nr:universal stress protein [Dysgonamonadaceae bacterium]
MEDTLITLAIHTYQKALMVKMLLGNEGIEVFLHNVNQIQPVVSAGVRIRIKESDLPKALRLIEELDFFKKLEQEENGKGEEIRTKTILIPVDFSDYSLRACELGFNYAYKTGANIHIIHAYYTPIYPASISIGDSFMYQTGNEEMSIEIFKKVQDEMKKLNQIIQEKISSGQWENVNYTDSLHEGLPEEEIIRISKELKPLMIIMGTRGKNQKDQELIGSVTAEVIERTHVPVFAIPENTPLRKFSQVRNVAFGTSFEQKDLISMDTLFNALRDDNISFYLFHITHNKQDTWNEIKLGGIKEYLSKQYPELKIHYDIIDGQDFVLNLEKFIRNNAIDVITLTTYHRNIFSRIFNPSMARRMLFHTDTPILVLRE